MFGYACDRCREKHQSCNHELPCKRCIKANVADSCHYTPKRTRSKNAPLVGHNSMRHHLGNGGFPTRGMGVSVMPNATSQAGNPMGMNNPNGMMFPPHMMHPDAFIHMMMNNPPGANPYMMGVNGNGALLGPNNPHPMAMMMDPSGMPYFGPSGMNGGNRQSGDNSVNSTMGSVTSPHMMIPVGGMFPPYPPPGMMEEQMMHMGMMNHPNGPSHDIASQLPPFMTHPMMFPFPPPDSMIPMMYQHRQSQSGQGSGSQPFPPMSGQSIQGQGLTPYRSSSQSQTPLQPHASLPMLPHPYSNMGLQRDVSSDSGLDNQYRNLDGSNLNLRRSITPGSRGQDGASISANGSSASLEKLSLPAMDHHRLSGSGLFPMPQQSSQHLQNTDSGAPLMMPPGFPFNQRKSNSALGEALLFPQDMVSNPDDFNPAMLPMLAPFQSHNPMMPMGPGPFVPFPQGYTFPPMQLHGLQHSRNSVPEDSNNNTAAQHESSQVQASISESTTSNTQDENTAPIKTNAVTSDQPIGKLNGQAPLPTMLKLLNSGVTSEKDVSSQ